MDIAKYREIYEAILELTMDAESITEEDVDKCKWIACMLEALTDVPARKAAYVFQKKGINFKAVEFLDAGFYDN